MALVITSRRVLTVRTLSLIVLLVAQPVVAGHGPPGILVFDRPPTDAVALDLVVLIPLDPRAKVALASPGRIVHASDLIQSYRTAQLAPPESYVDLCQVIKAAEEWIPTAQTTRVPLYVPVAIALEPPASENCSGVVSGPIRLNKQRADAVLWTFGGFAGPPDRPTSWTSAQVRAMANLSRQARLGVDPRAMSIGKPSAYYLKHLLRSANLRPTYPAHNPDKFLFVDMVFTVRESPLGEYKAVTFSVKTSTKAGEVTAHFLMPEAFRNGAGQTVISYEVQATGFVQPAGDKEGARWVRRYERLLPVIESFGRGETQYGWKFTGGPPIRGPKNPSVIITLPRESVGHQIGLKLQLWGTLVNGLEFVTDPIEACFTIEIRRDDPEVSRCRTKQGSFQRLTGNQMGFICNQAALGNARVGITKLAAHWGCAMSIQNLSPAAIQSNRSGARSGQS